ncbi:SDR family NAD(P)-dependent oxidoreductase [Bacillus solimangrovi]|uniref:Short chain dehydrogenase n=1 Tax=Bacillus solimangrovi TaxID=1305675 RepID=A0A1E5LH25_9BACI|nr:SDR family NAD(P)-dependent oxidoreductase [Bacillus solimangrovi]OEH93374.1 short chain dehydrogenase [Bacillus solimangrovi]
MKKALVLGATGGMGSAIVEELAKREVEVVAFARSEKKLNNWFANFDSVTPYVGDVFDQASLSKAAEDVDIIFHAINIPYQDWEEKQPKLMQNIIEIAQQKGAKLAIVDNIYAYGRSEGLLVKESKQKNPHTKKGKIRLQLEEMIKNSSVLFFIAHFPDFYGPRAENTLVHYTLQSIVDNKRAMFVGNQQIAREYMYTPDGARAMVDLAERDDVFGQNWNISGSGVITGEEVVRIASEHMRYKKKVLTVKKSHVRLLGIVDKFMREYVEMFYLNEQPVVLDGEKYEMKVGSLKKTPYKQGIENTLRYMVSQ